MASEHRPRRETSIIARIRPGSHTRAGTYTITMVIAETLRQYRKILCINYSGSNFIIGLHSPDIQLAVLYSRMIEGSDFILDIVPWCSEHANFNLPWIVTRTKQVIPPPQAAAYIRNLKEQGEPLQKHISAVIQRQGVASLQVADTESDPEIIRVSSLVDMKDAGSAPDFSYLMILELKDFYRDKFEAFRKCVRSCKELCDCAYQLSKDIDPALKSIDVHSQAISAIFDEETGFLVSSFGSNVQYEALYIAEEIFGIDGNIGPLFSGLSPRIDLTSFKRRLNPSQGHPPNTYSSCLRVTLDAVIQHIYNTPATFTSEITETGNVITHISAPSCSEYYKSSPMIPKDEAESDAIYKFLRHKTNVLGYNIVDINYPTLARLVNEINNYNQEVNELLLCATRAANMIRQVHEDLDDMYKELLKQIPRTNIAQLNGLVGNLLETTQVYSTVANHGLDTFAEHKRAYESIVLETRHRHLLDHSHLSASVLRQDEPLATYVLVSSDVV